MNAYFIGKGDSTTFSDYAQPLEDIAVVSSVKCRKTLTVNVSQWITKSINVQMPVETRARLLMMMGDCLKNTGNTAKANNPITKPSS
ncbi:MAG: hypothetical protein ACLU4J_19410 [Butyricimonas paravirosa]